MVDETGFLKKGTRSAGVKRQYTGTAGKVENCQVGIFLAYVAPRGQTFLDRRLYLPQEWCEDPERRRAAKVPQDVTFRTKPQLAAEMLRHAWQQGVPMRWVTGDEVYGDFIRAQEGCDDVLAVSAPTPVWTERPVAGRDASPATVAAVVASWPAERWQRLIVAEGEKGLRTYDWACGRVVESRNGQPGPDAWLLARRSVNDPTEVAYYLSSAAEDTPLLRLAQVASSRYAVEQVIEEGKGETGLDEYEVRYWHSWYRHITLSYDGSCLVGLHPLPGSGKRGAEPELAELTVPEVRRLLGRPAGRPCRTPLPDAPAGRPCRTIGAGDWTGPPNRL